MAEGPPSADKTIPAFLDYLALACIFAFVDALVAGRSWPILTGTLIAAIVFHLVGIKWTQISQSRPRLTARLGRVARYKKTAMFLLALYIITTILVYAHSLRSDLDTYAMPRIVKPQQKEALHAFLAQRGPHSVTIKVDPLDEEAREYWGQLLDVLRETDWIVEESTANGDPNTLNAGLCLGEEGPKANPNDRRHDPKDILEQAFRDAHILINCSTTINPAAANYKLYLLVGHRPYKLVPYPPSRFFKMQQDMDERMHEVIERLTHR